ncbi:MAG: hypothetical protein SGPRY_000702 [Prymnesium sp.]
MPRAPLPPPLHQLSEKAHLPPTRSQRHSLSRAAEPSSQRARCSSHDCDAFQRFSAQLFCSGAMQQRCILPDLPSSTAGTCLWFTQDKLPVREIDMNRSISDRHASKIIRRWPSDRWDPVAAGVLGFRYFDQQAAEACVRSKRVLIAGDSTTRDTFYEFSVLVRLA